MMLARAIIIEDTHKIVRFFIITAVVTRTRIEKRSRKCLIILINYLRDLYYVNFSIKKNRRTPSTS